MRLKITMDCRDLDSQATSWCSATDYERLPGWSDCYVNLRPRGDRFGRPDFLLQRVPEEKQAKNRLPVDLHPDDGPAAVARLEGLGQFGPVRSTPSS